MSVENGYIPYETLARAEAQNIIGLAIKSVLREMPMGSVPVIEELLADAYYRGIETGFGLSDGYHEDPVGVVEAYLAGIEQGKKEGES